MNKMREKFVTQVDAKLLQDLRELSDLEGRQIQNLVEEALVDLIEKHRGEKARPHVMEAYKTAQAKYGNLFIKLAK